MNIRQQLSNLQQAIWKLEHARILLEEACETMDPNVSAINKIIEQIHIDMDALWEEENV